MIWYQPELAITRISGPIWKPLVLVSVEMVTSNQVGRKSMASMPDQLRREDDTITNTLALGGDPTLDVSSLPRSHEDPIDALGWALAQVDHSSFGFGRVENDGFSSLGGASWNRFWSAAKYFIMREALTGGMKEPEKLCSVHQHQRATSGVYTCTAWGNGCNFDGLFCTTTKLYRLRYTNG